MSSPASPDTIVRPEVDLPFHAANLDADDLEYGLNHYLSDELLSEIETVDPELARDLRQARELCQRIRPRLAELTAEWNVRDF